MKAEHLFVCHTIEEEFVEDEDVLPNAQKKSKPRKRSKLLIQDADYYNDNQNNNNQDNNNQDNNYDHHDYNYDHDNATSSNSRDCDCDTSNKHPHVTIDISNSDDDDSFDWIHSNLSSSLPHNDVGLNLSDEERFEPLMSLSERTKNKKDTKHNKKRI